MVHEGQRLPLGLETSDHLAAVHARLDDLESNLALDRLRLLGHVDGAHAAFADLLQQLIGTDDCPSTFARRNRRSFLARRRSEDSRSAYDSGG
jgi:hypothetical protein